MSQNIPFHVIICLVHLKCVLIMKRTVSHIQTFEVVISMNTETQKQQLNLKKQVLGGMFEECLNTYAHKTSRHTFVLRNHC